MYNYYKIYFLQESLQHFLLNSAVYTFGCSTVVPIGNYIMYTVGLQKSSQCEYLLSESVHLHKKLHPIPVHLCRNSFIQGVSKRC